MTRLALVLSILGAAVPVWAEQGYSATLNWKPEKGATYNIYRCDRDGTQCLKIVSNLSVNTYTDKGVAPGREYRYKVTTVRNNKEGPPAEKNAVIPSQPKATTPAKQ
jgi:fibronectin type 3 domain-containing protein